MTPCQLLSNHKSVSLTVTEICQVENFQGQFHLDLISQGHPKCDNSCTMTSFLYIFNHKSVSLMVTEIWQIEIFQGQFDLDLISQGHPKCDK